MLFRGQRFESSRVRHTARSEEIRGSWLDHSRTKERIFAGMRPGSVRLVPICGCFTSCAFYPDGIVCSRSEEHTSELQSLMRISYAVFCLKKKKKYEHIIFTTS